MTMYDLIKIILYPHSNASVSAKKKELIETKINVHLEWPISIVGWETGFIEVKHAIN